MQRIQEFHESENNVNLERSLKWLLFLPHALMRQPTRGGAAGRQIIAKRFNCIVEDNWSNLIDLFMRDREACQQKRERKENMYLSKKKSGDLTRKTNNAVSLISKGHISKAQNRMTSFGVADLNNPVSKEALAKKYPKKSRVLPQSVLKGEAVTGMKTMRDVFLCVSCYERRSSSGNWRTDTRKPSPTCSLS